MPPQEQEASHHNAWDQQVGASGRKLDRKNESLVNEYLHTMEHLDVFPPIERPSIFHRESFIVQFASKKGPRVIIILIVCLAMGVGSTVGVVPAVMTDRYARLNHGYSGATQCGDYDMHSKPQACLDGSADAQNASATANLINNILTFITSSLMGSLSDEHGRRSLLIIGVFMSCLSPMCLVLMQCLPGMSPTWYYAASASTGIINWIAVALSSLSDVMPPQWRAASFGMLLAGLYLGFASAPTLALVLGHFQVSVLAFTMVFLALINTIAFFPETLSPEMAAIAKGSRRSLVAGMTQGQHVLWNITRPARELSILNRNDLFRLLSALAFFSGMVGSGDQTLLIYYVEERLAFNDRDIATMFMITGVMGILCQAVVLKPLIECVGERMVVTFCFLIGAFDNFMYGIAKHKSLIYVAMSMGSLTAMSFPTISAIKANNVSESEQGRIQGALYSVQALASGTGPMAMRFVYHVTKDGAFLGPGSMFVFASGLMLVASGCAFALPKDKADSRPSRRFGVMPSMSEEYSETTEEHQASFADATTPFLGDSPSRSSPTYGTDLL